MKAPKSADEYIGEVGFKPYNYILLVLIGMMGLSDGCQSLSQSVVLPKIKDESFLTEPQIKLLESLTFVGVLCGSVLAGPISDNVGRRKPLLISYVILTLASFISADAQNALIFLTTRFIVGVIVGFAVPISFSCLAENTPPSSREKILAIIGIFYVLGQLMSCLFLYLSFETLKKGDWRLLLRYSSLLPLLTLVSNYLLLEESLSFLWSCTEKESAKVRAKEIKSIVTRISPKEKPELRDLANLEQWLEKKESKISKDTAQTGVLALFYQESVSVTLTVWFCWIVNNVVYFGLSFILPMTLTSLKEANKDQENYGDRDILQMTLATLGELPSTFILTIILGTIGWKNSLIVSYGLTALFSFTIYMQVANSLFTFFISIMKLLMNLAFSTGYVFTVQIYDTKMRASGLGAASTVSRVGSILMPWIVVNLHTKDYLLPYLFFGAMCAVASYLVLAVLKNKK